MPKIELLTHIKAPKSIVFDLSRSIDLHKISTQQTNEETIDGVTTGLIGLGQSVTWRAKHFGIYQKLTVKITSFEYPDFFVDEMISGIFHSFRHEHHFKDDKLGTKMHDVFEYKSPLGILGKIADTLFLKRYMRNLLMKRNKTIQEFAESERWREILSS